MYEDPKHFIKPQKQEPIKRWTEFRCMSCGKLLGRGQIGSGFLEIKCKCGAMVCLTVYGSMPSSTMASM